MNTEKKIEEKINYLLKSTKSAGFTKPPSDYFEHFADNLPIEKMLKTKSINQFRNNWIQLSSLAVAAMLLLALWVFVFDADIKNDTDVSFTMEELMALNDFQNYNEDLIYGELALVSDEDMFTNDTEVDVLLEIGTISTDDLIDFYLTEDSK